MNTKDDTKKRNEMNEKYKNIKLTFHSITNSTTHGEYRYTAKLEDGSFLLAVVEPSNLDEVNTLLRMGRHPHLTSLPYVALINCTPAPESGGAIVSLANSFNYDYPRVDVTSIQNIVDEREMDRDRFIDMYGSVYLEFREFDERGNATFVSVRTPASLTSVVTALVRGITAGDILADSPHSHYKLPHLDVIRANVARSDGVILNYCN